jgi:protein-arginine deiminase
LILASCAGKEDGDGPAEAPADPGVVAVESLDGAVWAVANLDDDDEDGTVDLGLRADDDELVPLGFAEGDFDSLTDGRALTLTLSDAGGHFRVWADGAVLLGGPDGETTATLDAEVDPETLRVEVGDFAVEAALDLSLLGDDGEPLLERGLSLHGAPLILNHHLQDAVEIAAIEFAYPGWGTNDPMLDDIEDVVDDGLLRPDGRPYQYDVWVQDEMEFGTASVPGHRIDVVIDSIRTGSDRNLDAYAEDWYLGPDEAVGTWGSGRPSSQDSFGNLEVTPPMTIDGVDYPFGRVYYGDGGGYQAMNGEMQEFLTRQAVQAPFVLDIGWLCVGHVDEFVTFLPDPSAPRGFRLYVADTTLGLALIDSLDPSTSVPMYRDHGYGTVGDMVEDAAMRAWNEDLQLDEIEPNIETLERELSLESGELVRVPALFERSSECGGTALALIPATVNLAAWTEGGGAGGHLFLPDPFLRERVSDLDSDPVIAAVEELLPPSTTPHWVDDWDVYHLAWGEVHCGTNVRREQPLDWWTEAAHLVEETP